MRAGDTTPFGSLLNVPLVDDPTEQGTNQEKYKHSLLSEDNNQGVCIGEALLPVPKKLFEHIWRQGFNEMGELLSETWNLKLGVKVNQQRLLVRRKKPVTHGDMGITLCHICRCGLYKKSRGYCWMMIVKAVEEYTGLA